MSSFSTGLAALRVTLRLQIFLFLRGNDLSFEFYFRFLVARPVGTVCIASRLWSYFKSTSLKSRSKLNFVKVAWLTNTAKKYSKRKLPNLQYLHCVTQHYLPPSPPHPLPSPVRRCTSHGPGSDAARRSLRG